MEIEKVGVNMFEKDEEEILNNYCDCELLPECISGIRCRCSDFEEKKKLLLEGIEFGYNKAFVEADKNLKAELEKENAELKARLKYYSEQICNKECAEVWGELTEAKKIIGNLFAICKDNHYPNCSVLMEQAEQFLKEALDNDR